VALRRGFKAESERIADELWEQHGLDGAAALDPRGLATTLGVEVRSADELVPIVRLHELDAIQPGVFSACTFRFPPTRSVVIYNPLSAPTRRNSYLAHELSHVVLRHKLSRVERLDNVSFFSCDANQEEEANWLGGAILLPRFALLHDLRAGLTPRAIASQRELSPQMVDFRINVTGAARQLQRERAAKKRR
jgi:Zn-dependent peptidase ImmA (M78 family)